VLTWPCGCAREQIEKLITEYYSSKQSLPNLAQGKRIDYVIRKLYPRQSSMIDSRMHDGTDPLANSASLVSACAPRTRPAEARCQRRLQVVHQKAPVGAERCQSGSLSMPYGSDAQCSLVELMA
jgi:hypothetical protein